MIWKSNGLIIIIAISSMSVSLILQTASVSAQMLDVPIGDELYRDAYDFIDRMLARRAVGELFKNTQPYSNADVIKIFVELDKKAKGGQLRLSSVEKHRLEKLLRLFSIDKEDAHLLKTQGRKHLFFADFGVGESALRRDEKTASATLLRPTISGQIRDDFAFYSDLKLYYLAATQFKDFPKSETRIGQWDRDSSTTSLTTYYIKVGLPWIVLFFGKDNLHWGPGRHGALSVSKQPLPMNIFKLTAQYHPVKFQAFTAGLGSELDEKYMSGHRLEFTLWDRINLGMVETVIYGKRFEVSYLNPVQIYGTTEISEKSVAGEKDTSPDNVLISGDLDIRLLDNFSVYGELMLDDFRPLVSYKNWGTKFGVLFGGFWIDPFSLPDTEFRGEYTFVNQYAYTHIHPINTYTHFDSIIGHQIGTDADDLWLNLKHWFTANLSASISYELERHGEGDVNKPHLKSEPQEDEWEFLSGVTESTHSIGLDVSCNAVGKYSVDLEYSRSWLRNAGNQEGVSDTKDQVLLSGQYRF